MPPHSPAPPSFAQNGYAPRMTEPGAARPALRDVAERSGYSISQVSRVLAGGGNATATTRARIRAAADEVGYRRGENGGRPRAQQPRLIELALGHFEGGWADDVVSGTRAAATRLGYDLVLTAERDEPGDDWPERVASRGSVGVVLGIIRPTTAQLRTLQAAGIPIVLLEPSSDPPRGIASVGATDRAGGYAAGRHLALAGVEHVLIATGRTNYRFGRARVAGCRAALGEYAPHLEVEQVAGGWQPEATYRAILPVLRGIRGRVGVFCVSDDAATGVYVAAKELGRVIPDDVAVIGFDDRPFARRMSPPLTTVRQPIRDMAARAVELLLDAGGAATRVELPTELIVRQSA
jgi:LacI family transcriptional regulator